MRKSRMVYAIFAVALSGMVVKCSNPAGPAVTPPDKAPGTIILSEGFEGDLSEYKQLTYLPGQGMMSLSTQKTRWGKGSLTSDSDNTSLRRPLDPSIDDSIAGLQFYLMATRASHTNFTAGLCKIGSSANGVYAFYGIGIDRSDSLNYIFQNAPNDPINEQKNFAALALNKWYKCKIEYNFSDTTLTYYLDNTLIRTMPAPSPLTIGAFVAMRDSAGAQGASGYYIDEVSIYKR